jgi:adenylate cyclase
MPELVAKGAGQSRRWTLTDRPVTLGRSAESEWQIPWDKLISGLHATLTWQGGRLLVRRRLFPTKTTNPVFYKGAERDEFSIAPGDEFVIGATTFRLVEERPAAELPPPLTELTCGVEELRRHRYVDANERIEVLAALPAFIRFSPGEAELEARVVDVLLRGIPRAEAAAVVRLGEDGSVRIRASATARKQAAEIRPSTRLVRATLLERKQSVMHVWQAGDLAEGAAAFTMVNGYDWAMCTPLPDDPAANCALYLAGTMPEVRLGGPSRDDLLKSDLKFAELVAEVFGALRQVGVLQKREGQLSRFFSRPVRNALAGRDIDAALKPRLATVTVLFCDLRGSCAIAEDGQSDLMALWRQVNTALSIMSSSILEQDGVIGDFQGDAAMGFWGWPLDRDDQIERAARAALAIRRRFAEFAEDPDHPLARFACGIGLAHGPAVAGRLGTLDQFKVDVFGPIVNLAARLESMTKRFGVPILIDEACGKRLTNLPIPRRPQTTVELDLSVDGGSAEDAMPSASATAPTGAMRCRRLARVRPHGMKLDLTVSELMPPENEPDATPESHRRGFEAAVDAFLSGRWPDARSLLQPLPRDGASAFLTAFMDRHPDGPPADWNGVVVIEGK